MAAVMNGGGVSNGDDSGGDAEREGDDGDGGGCGGHMK